MFIITQFLRLTLYYTAHYIPHESHHDISIIVLSYVGQSP